MRLRDVEGWPPYEFEGAEVNGHAGLLRLQALCLVPGIGGPLAPEICLILEDRLTAQICSTRLRVKDGATAIRVAQALSAGKGKTFEDLGEILLP